MDEGDGHGLVSAVLRLAQRSVFVVMYLYKGSKIGKI